MWIVTPVMRVPMMFSQAHPYLKVCTTYFLFCFPVQLLYQSGSEAEVDRDPFVEDSDEKLNQTDHQQSETSRIVALIVYSVLVKVSNILQDFG
jgi:hypothetical protein